ncbi:MAG: poly-gamma-glutamate biosynthesis protein [Candidatus Falkowbacteria bacterium GW2011_GWC2_38_22]|uniref:Poly-gamma-glutamate biosynthesis protein n=1 Tax=Candidatus Falkowbacteria bacterium GW2011_GWE1_38_31 TaxID=1618638 RepID=A0A0G0MYC5_9BACT|nr:MAG: poly-gamma-glutamate biosynthesis protein [Candidatus Falkowbacteria bacterium GW2011_GWF2_38_1205]KKQ61295.1 MAG: poly-gamma-glutamate biosynthesis protein [Candidatus Falkowbacteria bacterium GW2011_GWC2_38_22]KKQ63133.1 MAG: poly-gamma-glutamate biosynthesis protein [Candidatus Falkowbacteria bacterium GW2011_GWF1_38_22]KKQ65330.1 MAG: poly-gamma-glutamate biosynthesis protein [Candidatus Falkowbacteria bacterium GW2011_GWE2_38_254]KKQ69906.1 MAG: poly-gamma-glutamate biosynthesis pr
MIKLNQMNSLSKKILITTFIISSFLVGLFFVIKNASKSALTLQRNVSVPDNTIETSKTAVSEITDDKKDIKQNPFPENVDNQPARFLFFGDVMLDRHIKERYGKDFAVLLNKLKETDADFFKGYDLVAANLEGAVMEGGAHYPPVNAYDFSFSPESVRDFSGDIFNFFNIANNHILDQGQAGFLETGKNLDKLGIGYSGCPDGKVGECTLKIIDVADVKTAMIGLSIVFQNVPKEELKKILVNAEAESDFVIVNIHWGTEYGHVAGKSQVEFAHYLIDNGVDLIIGHHPHVIQGIEKYQDKLIFYSLGNFIFDQYFSPDTQEGFGVGVDYDLEKITYELIPYQSKIGIPDLLQKDAKAALLKKIADWSDGDEGFKDEIRAGEIKNF